MGSFVPLGGFFSSPDVKGSFCNSYQLVTRCSMCSQEEIASVSNRGCVASLADNQKIAISPRLQIAEHGDNNTFDNLKAKGGKLSLSAPVEPFPRNPGNLCQCRGAHIQPSPKPKVPEKSCHLRADVGFCCLAEKIKNVKTDSSCATTGSCKEYACGRIKSFTSIDLQKSVSQSSMPVSAKIPESSPYSHCISCVDDDQTPPSLLVSVSTDLGLELFPRAYKQQKKVDEHSAYNSGELFKALFGRIGRQCEALRVISQIIAHSWASSGRPQKPSHRGDIWLNLTGPDVFGKRKVALILAKVLFGSNKNIVHVDLCSGGLHTHQKTIFGYEIVHGSEARSRGKTVVDHIADELRRTPSCVVLLENVDCADPLLQRSLLRAIKDGKYPDSYGREVATNNRVFVLTLKSKVNNPSSFPEERIERAKGCPLQIVVKGVQDCISNIPCQMLLNKRKLIGTDENTEQRISVDHAKRHQGKSSTPLDLNLPAETSEDEDANYIDIDEGNLSWLDEYSDQLSRNMVKLDFEPFDYDALATKILKSIHASFREVIKSKCVLEIEPKVVDQIIAASCLCEHEKEVEDWIGRVLSKGFDEAQKQYQLTVRSTVVIAACEAPYIENQVQEPYLPSKIVLISNND
ncbi:unnamed protein product [Amaranthus hypochondriacus]